MTGPAVLETAPDARTFGDVLRACAAAWGDKTAFETLAGKTLTFDGLNGGFTNVVIMH